jgi:hypothetical protein
MPTIEIPHRYMGAVRATMRAVDLAAFRSYDDAERFLEYAATNDGRDVREIDPVELDAMRDAFDRAARRYDDDDDLAPLLEASIAFAKGVRR